MFPPAGVGLVNNELIAINNTILKYTKVALKALLNLPS